MALKFPNNVNKPEDKLAYACRVVESCRMLHNIIGQWRREGMTTDEYDNGVDGVKIKGKPGKKWKLTNSVKAKHDDKKGRKLSEGEFKQLIGEEFEARWKVAQVEVDNLLELFRLDENYDADIDMDALEG